MVAELAGKPMRPLLALRRHQQRRRQVRIAAAQKAGDLLGAARGQNGAPAQRDHVAAQAVESSPARQPRVQRLQRAAVHQAADLNCAYAARRPRGRPGLAEVPFFFLHSIAPVLLTNGAVALNTSLPRGGSRRELPRTTGG